MARWIGFCAALAFAPLVAAEIAPLPIDLAASRLEFVAQQAGLEFRGHFETFDAEIRFDADALADSSVRVTIDVGSVRTGDGERDEILTGAGWFETAVFPTARFEARAFVPAGDGYVANGELTIRDVTRPVRVEFRVADGRLAARAILDRLDFGLGTGDWADPDWIGHEVVVDAVLIVEADAR